jgi:hypothetical protein
MHGARTGKRRNTKVLVGSAEGKRPLWKQQELEENVKIDLHKQSANADWTRLTWKRD